MNEAKNHGRVVARDQSRNRSRPWPVTAVSLLLAGQGLGLLGYAIYSLRAVLEPLTPLALLNDPVIWIIGLGFILLAILALVTFLICLRWQRVAWQSAVFVQGLSLLAALVLYFSQGKPYVSYIIMLYSIFMVLYLNHHEVYAAFRPDSDEEGVEQWTS